MFGTDTFKLDIMVCHVQTWNKSEKIQISNSTLNHLSLATFGRATLRLPPPVFNYGQFDAVFGRFSSFCFTYRISRILVAIWSLKKMVIVSARDLGE